MIIAFVGIDGSGKSTLISMFEEYLKKCGKNVKVIKALKQNTIFMKDYNAIRDTYRKKFPDKMHEFNIITSYLLSFNLYQESESIKKIDSLENIIILDRWAICQRLYAKVWQAENDFSNMTYDLCLEPDLVFVIDSHMDLIKERIERRGGANEFENVFSLRRLKRLYRDYSNINEKSVLVENNGEINEAFLKIIEEYKMQSV